MNGISIRNVELVMHLINDMSKEEWEAIKNFIDDNYKDIEVINACNEEIHKISSKLKAGLLNLKTDNSN